MEIIIKEIANKYGKKIELIKTLFDTSFCEGNSLEETKLLINDFYKMKVGAK